MENKVFCQSSLRYFKWVSFFSKKKWIICSNSFSQASKFLKTCFLVYSINKFRLNSKYFCAIFAKLLTCFQFKLMSISLSSRNSSNSGLEKSLLEWLIILISISIFKITFSFCFLNSKIQFFISYLKSSSLSKLEISLVLL